MNNPETVGKVALPQQPDVVYVLPVETSGGNFQFRLIVGMLAAFILGYLLARKLLLGE